MPGKHQINARLCLCLIILWLMIQNKGTIRDAEGQLDAKRFFRCNRCYLVNLEYVDNYMGSDVSVNGDTIQVSRSRRKPFLDALNEYLNEVGK